MLTHEYLCERLAYDPNSGRFTWRTSPRFGWAGKLAGNMDDGGYWRIRIDNRSYKLHRLAWFYVHGRWPAREIDHINGNQSDNRLHNLREATRADNNHNTGINSNNRSGIKGVSWCTDKARWVVQIGLNGRRRHVGYYESVDEAARAYADEAQKLFGQFARPVVNPPANNRSR